MVSIIIYPNNLHCIASSEVGYCTLHIVDFPLFLVATAKATLPLRLAEPEKCSRLGA